MFTMSPNGLCSDRDIGNLIDQGMRPKLILFNYIGANYFLQSDLNVFDFGLYNCTLKNNGGYPIGNGNYIVTTDNNNLKLGTVKSINDISIEYNLPSGTFINVLVSFDGKTNWSKWDGTSWIDHPGGISGLSSGNTIPELVDGFNNLILHKQTSIDFAFELGTVDGVNTPEITHVYINPIKGIPFIVSFVYGIGGIPDAPSYDCIAYSPNADTWSIKTATSLIQYAVGFAIESKGYIVGGYDGNNINKTCHEYLPDTWVQKSNIPLGNSHGSAESFNNKGYTVNGLSVYSPVNRSNQCYEYTPDTWLSKATMPGLDVSSHAAFVLTNGVHVCGGYYDHGYTSNVAAFDGAVWTQKAELLTGKGSMGTSTINNKGYCIGGTLLGNPAVYLPNVDEYTPDTWVGKTNMQVEGIHTFGVTQFDNKLYKIGGKNGAQYFDSCDEYTPDTWVSKQRMYVQRYYSISLSL